jgi:hypothetical protein
VFPAAASLETGLVAGANALVVLRASVVSGGPVTGVSWTWKGIRDGTVPVGGAIVGQQDPSEVAFPIASAGTYIFTAQDSTGACEASLRARPVAANACPDCDNSVVLRAAPPPSVDIPVQSGSRGLSGSAPFSQTNVVLNRGVAVAVAPSIGGSLVPSYVRINAASGDLVVDGQADPKVGSFGARLLAVDSQRNVLKYDVLVVPLDGTDGTSVAATAPQLFQSLTPANIKGSSFGLGGGVKVTGTAKRSNGQPVGDVRVMLTNQDPTSPSKDASGAPQSSPLIFSSVGSSAIADGSFLLHAQPGKYWISFSPSSGSDLAEALAPTAVTLTGDTTLDFKWDVPNTSTLVLNVVDAAGAATPGMRVRLTSALSSSVGILTVGSAGTASTIQSANGNVQVEGTTDANGAVTFENLPVGDGVAYDVLLAPATLGPAAATTALSLAVPAGGTQNIRLRAQGRIKGQLTVGSASASPPAIDWTRVNVVAYDRSNDTPEAPLAIAANPDGTFSMAVSPGRPYVLLAVPDVSTGFARTFVGPGLLQSSEFTITQNVQAAMTWAATVMDEGQNDLAGTALQVFCAPSWPGCIDSTLPLAETTSQADGSFQLALPDPATR